jgi:hypothetical protein
MPPRAGDQPDVAGQDPHPIAAVPAPASGVFQGSKNLAAFGHSSQWGGVCAVSIVYLETPVPAERLSYLHDNRTRWQQDRTDRRRAARHRPRPGLS